MKELGLRLNVRKVCFSSTENLLSGRVLGSDRALDVEETLVFCLKACCWELFVAA